MLAKKTSKNQVTLPKAIVRQLPDAEYFDVSLRDGEVVLRPVVISTPGERLKAVREVVRRDPDDDKFLECAVAGRGQYLVTGDRDLRELDSFRGTTILTA